MSGIGIITNPFSKLNKKDPDRTKLLGYILGEQGRLEMTRSLDELQKAAYKFKASEIRTLAINGGDGTISRTLTAFIRAYGEQPLPKVALLRGGTMNVLANNLRIYGSPETLLCKYIEATSQNENIPITYKSLPTLNIEGHYGFLYADGMCVNVLKEFYANKGNAFSAGLLVAKIVASALVHGTLFKKVAIPIETKINFKDEKHIYSEHKLQSLGILAATFEKMPLGPKLFPHAKKHANKFQFFSVACQAKYLLRNLPKILIQNKLGAFDYKFNQVTNELRLSTEKSFYEYSLDGELYKSENPYIDIKLGPKIEFIIA